MDIKTVESGTVFMSFNIHCRKIQNLFQKQFPVVHSIELEQTPYLICLKPAATIFHLSQAENLSLPDFPSLRLNNRLPNIIVG